jgi:hypothetical protein
MLGSGSWFLFPYAQFAGNRNIGELHKHETCIAGLFPRRGGQEGIEC